MGFIKHALIGIALYEAVKYILKKEDSGLELADDGKQWVSAVNQRLRGGEVDVITGARQTDQLGRLKENAASGGNSARSSEGLASQSGVTHLDSGDELLGGTDPEVPLIGKASNKDDPWKNSLASDELRAPDS